MDVETRQKLYTLRWHVKQSTSESREAALALLGELLGETPASPPLSAPALPPASARPLLYCPWAEKYGKDSHTRGEYAGGYPRGAVVHFTAGHQEQSISDALDYQVQQGYTYFFIDKDGKVGQNFPLNEWGYHAGESKWEGLGTGVSSKLVGIEIANCGKLNAQNAPWFSPSKSLPPDQIRKVPSIDNMEEGSYQRYTIAQEESLIKLVLWLYHNNPEAFNLNLVLGHDEVSGLTGLGWRRKNDPGGALSMSMPKFRKKIIELSK